MKFKNIFIILILSVVLVSSFSYFYYDYLLEEGTYHHGDFNHQIGDNEKLKLENVKNCPNNLCIYPPTTISIKKGEKANIFIKVEAFKSNISCSPGNMKNCEREEGALTYEIIDSNEYELNNNEITLAGPGFNAELGNKDARMYELRTNLENTTKGTYYLTIKSYSNTDYEISETITIEVE